MKKLLCLLSGLIIFTGCSSGEKVENGNKIEGRPDHHLIYAKTDYSAMASEIIELNVSTGKETVIIKTNDIPIMLRANEGKLYALFSSRIGVINGDEVKYLTSENEYVDRYTVSGDYLYYGKDNNNASDEIYESFAMKNVNGKEAKELNTTGVSQIVVGDYLYYKSNNGAEATKLYRYDLDGSNKKTILDEHIGQLISKDEYLYFIDYNDNSSIYKMKNDGTELVKLVDGPHTFNIVSASEIDGYSNFGVIEDYLYYINSKDSNKLYKTNGKTTELVSEGSFSKIKVVDSYIYCTYDDYTKYGIFLLDKDGKEIAKLTDSVHTEYVIK